MIRIRRRPDEICRPSKRKTKKQCEIRDAKSPKAFASDDGLPAKKKQNPLRQENKEEDGERKPPDAEKRFAKPQKEKIHDERWSTVATQRTRR
jgi:hypothetical protein